MFASYPPAWDVLVVQLGRKAKLLAWAETSSGAAVALIDRFAFFEAGHWSTINWEEIDSGTWNREQSTLRTRTSTGAEHQLVLPNPGKLPEVFEERVNASIVFARRIQVGSQYAMIAKRRNPADSHSGGTWRVAAGPGVDPNNPEILAELARVQEEFD